MTTELFQKQQEAEAAWNADDMNLDLLRASDAAYTTFMMAIKAARETWEAIPSSDAKHSAIDNAMDTEGTDEDELFWFQIAIRTYEMNIDCGYYNRDGSEIS